MVHQENHHSVRTERKRPIDITTILDRIRAAIEPFPKAAMFALAEEGYSSLFEQLVACIISTRTYDEVTLVCARRLFHHARTPEIMRALEVQIIDRCITPCTFHEVKAVQIKEVARRANEEFHGVIPCDSVIALSFHGSGPERQLYYGCECLTAAFEHIGYVRGRNLIWWYDEKPTIPSAHGQKGYGDR